jgi:polyphosphate glucokinase
MKILGIDIGGSALKGAPVDTDTGRLLAERYRIATPEPLTPAQMASAVAEMAKHFQWRGPVGVGFPSVIHGGRMMTASNVDKKFIGCPGQALFSKATRLRVSVVNDAAAAGLAEMRFGAGKGFEGKALLLTLGTGVGSALAYRGVVFPCELGQFPWKGRPVEKRVAASVKKAKGLTWARWAGRLDKYLQVVETLLWPELIIIGGGISAKSEKFFPYLHTRARLAPAEMLNDAGIVGAALHAADPPSV